MGIRSESRKQMRRDTKPGPAHRDGTAKGPRLRLQVSLQGQLVEPAVEVELQQGHSVAVTLTLVGPTEEPQPRAVDRVAGALDLRRVLRWRHR